MEGTQHEQESLFSMEIDEPIKNNFLEMARWTKFLAILGFVFLGLMLLGGVGMMFAISKAAEVNPVLSGIGGVGMFLLYALIVSIEFYPIYALFKFSTGIKQALATFDKETFYIAINWLKNMFRYMGVLAIICLSFYGIVIFFVMIAAMMR
jgi:hypothetical protein